MQKKLMRLIPALVIVLTAGIWLWHSNSSTGFYKIEQFGEDENNEAKAEEEEMAQRESFVKQRLQYEFDMVKDPATGKIPRGIYDKEMEQARVIPLRQYEQNPFAILSSPNSPN